jgi:ABC-2 type transport system permease protein
MSVADARQRPAALEPLRLSGRRTPAAFGRLLLSEIQLIVGRRRNQAGIAVLMLIPVIMTLALKLSSDGGDPGEGGPLFLAAAINNGHFVALAALGIEIGLFLPLAVSWLSGDAIAGEANLGTLRYLLTVPVGRTTLLGVKYLSLLIGALIGVVAVAVAGLVAGGIAFGVGPVTLLSGTQLGFALALVRLLLAGLYLTAGLSALAAVGLFISTLTEQPLGATIATVAFSTLMWILDTIPQLDWLHPWLLVDRWLAFADLLRDPVLLDTIYRGLLVDLAYAAVFLAAAWARFTIKDVSG